MNACICVRVFKAFVILDFCSNLTGGFVESFPDMILRFMKALPVLSVQAEGSQWIAYED